MWREEFSMDEAVKDGSPCPKRFGKRDAIRHILMSNGQSVAQGALA